MTQTLYATRDQADVQSLPLAWQEPPLQARDIMSQAPVTVAPDTSVSEAQALMRHHHIRHLPVLEDGRLVGMVSDRDIRLVLPSPATSLAKWEIHHLLTKLTVSEVMTRFVVAVKPECPLSEAVGRMLRHQIGALPVIDNRHLAGILTRTDVLRAFLKMQP